MHEQIICLMFETISSQQPGVYMAINLPCHLHVYISRIINQSTFFNVNAHRTYEYQLRMVFLPQIPYTKANHHIINNLNALVNLLKRPLDYMYVHE